jgi:calcium-dependent protein kinase
LGSGVSGIVRLVTHRETGINYAVKCLDIGLVDSVEGLRQLRNEIFIMCQLDHPNIVRIEEVYESTNEIYILQELCHGGDLFDRLDEQPDFHYTEAQCARLVKQMVSAVRYLHSKGIIHRDLKLENFLFSSQEPDSELKMIDFGLSKHFELGQSLHDKVGTPYTVAPEIIQGAYDEKCDVWAVGVITYLLLSGETPFGGLDGESLLLVKENIMRGELTFEPADVWAQVSEDGKGFVKRLLRADPKKRPTAREIQKDRWIQVWAKKDIREGNKLNSKTLESLVAFKENSDMQKILSEVLSFTLLPDQIADLRQEFELIDTDGDGEITLKALRSVLLENAEAGTLGALTEQEIVDIFDAIKTRKNEPTIRWHDFLAAGLSQARVDDRNLRLAFDRLDGNRRG